MTMMGTKHMNRRQFLLITAASAAATAGAALGVSALMKRAAQTTGSAHATTAYTLYSAADNAAGGHFLTRYDTQTQQYQSVAVNVRGHAILPMNNSKVLMFGRRPAFECAAVDFQTQTTRRIAATDGRHFDGHGCLSATGDVLFTTENDYDGVRGVLGIRDSQTFQHIGEYDTHGLDPHDVHLMPDGKTLVVANGGIQTHPDFGRRKLNIDTMQPSLAYLDAATGQKLDEYRLPDHLLSIRHLTVTAQGNVGAALQYEGDLYRQQPVSLVAWQHHGKELQLLNINSTAVTPLNGYMADLAYDPQQQILAVTSPRGNQITFWDIEKQQFLSAHSLTEPSGITFMPSTKQFLVTGATGEMHTVMASPTEISATQLHYTPDVLWDNHLVLI